MWLQKIPTIIQLQGYVLNVSTNVLIDADLMLSQLHDSAQCRGRTDS